MMLVIRDAQKKSLPAAWETLEQGHAGVSPHNLSFRDLPKHLVAMASLQTRVLLDLRLSSILHAPSMSTLLTRALLPRQLSQPLIPALSISIPIAVQLNIPSWITGVWDSVLRAVPKKKTSHSKSRHRQMAGKALKDVTALNKCSACGNVKRAHVLCPYCVDGTIVKLEAGDEVADSGRNPEHVAEVERR
jgi:ribosomal protein L32